MKRSLFISLVVCLLLLSLGMAQAAESVPVDAEHFPDGNFRSYVLENLDTDKNGALSKQEISAVTSLDVNEKDIASLKGVEYFTGLTTLSCSKNLLTSLDVANLTNLEYLDCRGNQLTSLDVAKLTNLTYLDCSWNQLTSLDVAKLTNLTRLFCENNQLTSLDVANLTNLTDLTCTHNQLTSLDVANLLNLKYLNCYDNQLTSLDVSSNPRLRNAVTKGHTEYYEFEFGNVLGYVLGDYEYGQPGCNLYIDSDVLIITTGNITILTLPANLVQIEAEAFYGCSAEEYHLGDQVTSIGASAFANLKGKAVIYMPSGDVSIADSAFEGSEVTLACTPGSAAEKWAQAHGIPVTEK